MVGRDPLTGRFVAAGDEEASEEVDPIELQIAIDRERIMALGAMSLIAFRAALASGVSEHDALAAEIDLSLEGINELI